MGSLEPESSFSLRPAQAMATAAPAMVALNANVAERPSRVVGKSGGGVLARSSAASQNGQAASLVRTWRRHCGQGTK
jgi:hypothetical protein